MSKSNVHILTGINAILNTDNTKPGINIKQLEKQMVAEGLISKQATPTTSTFDDEIKDAAAKIGISIDDILDTNSKPAPSVPEPIKLHEQNDDYIEIIDDVPANFTNIAIDKPLKNNNSLEHYTREQQRREHINTVMRSVDNNAPRISFEEEKKEDIKCEMLAEIDALMDDLEVEGVDLSRVPKVDKNSNYTDVENALKVLRHKNDHSQYCNFANELLLLLAHALGTLFDGKTIWFGKYRPDLTGWHNIVLQKTRRMRYNTGQIVHKFMQDYNISPFFRIIFELVPNMLIYSNTKAKGYGRDLYNDELMSNITKQL